MQTRWRATICALLMLSTAPADRKLVLSYWSGYMPTGTTIGMLLAPVLIAAYGWRALWLATVGCGIAAMALLFTPRRATSRVSRSLSR